MDLIGGFVIAFSMYSRIPMPRMEWTRGRMKYALCFFPAVGAVIGAAMIVFEQAAGYFNLSFPARAMVKTAIPLLITGGIHMDGFLDVTDALASFQPREKKLEILKDPHGGAFAIIGCGVYLLLYTAALLELPGEKIPVFAGVFVLSRALSGFSVVAFPKAKSEGLAAAFAGQAQRTVVGLVMGLYAALSLGYLLYLGGALTGGVCAAAAALVFLYYYFRSRREFGGITGDLAGYFLQLCELVLLAVLAVLH